MYSGGVAAQGKQAPPSSVVSMTKLELGLSPGWGKESQIPQLTTVGCDLASAVLVVVHQTVRISDVTQSILTIDVTER